MRAPTSVAARSRRRSSRSSVAAAVEVDPAVVLERRAGSRARGRRRRRGSASTPGSVVAPSSSARARRAAACRRRASPSPSPRSTAASSTTRRRGRRLVPSASIADGRLGVLHDCRGSRGRRAATRNLSARLRLGVRSGKCSTSNGSHSRISGSAAPNASWLPSRHDDVRERAVRDLDLRVVRAREVGTAAAPDVIRSWNGRSVRRAGGRSAARAPRSDPEPRRHRAEELVDAAVARPPELVRVAVDHPVGAVLGRREPRHARHPLRLPHLRRPPRGSRGRVRRARTRRGSPTCRRLERWSVTMTWSTPQREVVARGQSSTRSASSRTRSVDDDPHRLPPAEPRARRADGARSRTGVVRSSRPTPPLEVVEPALGADTSASAEHGGVDRERRGLERRRPREARACRAVRRRAPAARRGRACPPREGRRRLPLATSSGAIASDAVVRLGRAARPRPRAGARGTPSPALRGTASSRVELLDRVAPGPPLPLDLGRRAQGEVEALDRIPAPQRLEVVRADGVPALDERDRRRTRDGRPSGTAATGSRGR